jgi:hypothetical protein
MPILIMRYDFFKGITIPSEIATQIMAIIMALAKELKGKN